MDLNSLIGPLLAGNSPWMIVAGVALTLLYNRFLGGKPPRKSPAPSPTPGPTGRPLLDLLGNLLGRALAAAPAAPVGPVTSAAAATLAGLSLADLTRLRDTIGAEWSARVAELRRHLDAAPPEPAAAVK